MKSSGYRPLWLGPLALALAAFAGYGAWRLARPVYVHWRGERELAQARSFFARRDMERSSLALQEALRDNASAEAFRLAGDYLEAAGSSQAVDARRRACENRPGDLGLKLELANTALRFNDAATARQVVDSLDPSVRNRLEWRRTEAACALLQSDWRRADALLAGLEKDLPGDAGIRLLHDSFLVRQADVRKAEAAREDLNRLVLDPQQQVPALRVLLADAFARRARLDAARIGVALAAASVTSFSDLLDALSAELYGRPGSGGDPALVQRVLRRASTDPFAAAHYARWLLVQEGPAAAGAWLAGLSPDFRKNPVFVELDADVAAGLGDWNRLQGLLEAGAWGNLPRRAIAEAFRARSLRQKGSVEAAGLAWNEAVGACGASSSGQQTLARLAGVWQWPEAMRDALFAAVRSSPGDENASQLLIGLLHYRRDTRRLLELFALRKDALPPSPRRFADWALVSLLVDPAERPNPATRILADLYSRQPDDPYLATDYAFSLWQLRRYARAREVLDRLAPEDRAAAARAPYVAVVYASAGRWDDARAAIVRAPPYASLLPEEAALLARATALVGD